VYLHRREAFGDELVEGVEVALALGHLLALDHQVGAMEPVRGEALHAGGALGLGDLVLVVREAEVDAAAVQVEGGAEVRERHGRALDVPAGTALTPRGRPEVGAILRLAGLPEREVGGGLAFVLIGVISLAGGVLGLGLELGEIDVVQFAVIGAGADLEVDRTVLGDVGVAAVDEGLDHRDLLRDVLHRARLDMGRQETEGLAVGMELVGPGLREGAERLAGGLGPADGLVVDVGDVADVLHLQAGDLEGAAQDVLDGERAEIADVGRSVDRRPAAVHAIDIAAGLREQRPLLAGHGVMQEHGHRPWS
jgi:hypothetical protein